LLTDPAQAGTDRPRIAGLLLAAGAGTRYGQPKALVDTGSGPWIHRGLTALAACDPVLVVLGAGSEEVAQLLPPDVRAVLNPGFSDGMGSSLRVGLTVLRTDPAPRSRALGSEELPVGSAAARADSGQPDAALVMLVDLPGVGPAVIERVLAVVGTATAARSCLARAAYHGVPGHPVLLGFDHWAGVIDSAVGDRGARDYLRSSGVRLVECGDIGSGEDVDVRG
jgi:CTP:molybdopterin cytidylyltransferase MocA